MKLTAEQKQFIGEVYEKASALSESVTSPSHLITWYLDHYHNLDITLYDTSSSSYKRLTGDMLPLFTVNGQPNEKKIAAVLDEVGEYYQAVMGNREATRIARIAALEKELAELKMGA